MAADPAFAGAIDALCKETFATPAQACEPLAAGLGSRCFFRVTLGRAPWRVIARCERAEDPSLRPAGVPGEPPLEPIRAHLEQAGLPVPRRYGARDGVTLLEDLGDDTLESCVHTTLPQERKRLYGLACELVPLLQRLDGNPSRVTNFARKLDRPLFAYKADQVCRWLIPELSGCATTPAQRDVVNAAFDTVAAHALAAPQRLAHRDFKAQNLHVTGRASGSERVSMIDLQGAFLAPPEYDLVCLLRDLHVPLPAAEVKRYRERTRPKLPDAPARADFDQRFDLLTLSRAGKDTSRFLYAVQERGDHRYREFIPTGVRYVRDAAANTAALHPTLDRFHALIEELSEAPCAR
jgi:hypothetical protein